GAGRAGGAAAPDAAPGAGAAGRAPRRGGPRVSEEPFDRFAAGQREGRRNAVRLGAKAEHDKRLKALTRDYADPDALRRLAGAIKQNTLDHLDVYLEKAQTRLEANGATVHFASDAEEARQTVL